MDGGNEQRVVTKFCFKAGLSATETLVLVLKANGNEAVYRSKVSGWYSRFRDGRELVEDVYTYKNKLICQTTPRKIYPKYIQKLRAYYKIYLR
jgi:hypothetical protein